MAKVEVTYTVTMKQTIEWPEDEMADFNYENLHCNLDQEKARFVEIGDIEKVKVKGQDYEF